MAIDISRLVDETLENASRRRTLDVRENPALTAAVTPAPEPVKPPAPPVGPVLPAQKNVPSLRKSQPQKPEKVLGGAAQDVVSLPSIKLPSPEVLTPKRGEKVSVGDIPARMPVPVQAAGSAKIGYQNINGDIFNATFPVEYMRKAFQPRECGKYVRLVLNQFFGWGGKSIYDIQNNSKLGKKVPAAQAQSGDVIYLKNPEHWALLFRNTRDGKLYLNEKVTNKAGNFSVNQRRSLESMLNPKRSPVIYRPLGLNIPPGVTQFRVRRGGTIDTLSSAAVTEAQQTMTALQDIISSPGIIRGTGIRPDLLGRGILDFASSSGLGPEGDLSLLPKQQPKPDMFPIEPLTNLTPYMKTELTRYMFRGAPEPPEPHYEYKVMTRAHNDRALKSAWNYDKKRFEKILMDKYPADMHLKIAESFSKYGTDPLAYYMDKIHGGLGFVGGQVAGALRVVLGAEEPDYVPNELRQAHKVSNYVMDIASTSLAALSNLKNKILRAGMRPEDVAQNPYMEIGSRNALGIVEAARRMERDKKLFGKKKEEYKNGLKTIAANIANLGEGVAVVPYIIPYAGQVFLGADLMTSFGRADPSVLVGVSPEGKFIWSEDQKPVNTVTGKLAVSRGAEFVKSLWKPWTEVKPTLKKGRLIDMVWGPFIVLGAIKGGMHGASKIGNILHEASVRRGIAMVEKQLLGEINSVLAKHKIEPLTPGTKQYDAAVTKFVNRLIEDIANSINDATLRENIRSLKVELPTDTLARLDLMNYRGERPGVVPLMDGVLMFKRFYEGTEYKYAWNVDDPFPHVSNGRRKIYLDEWASRHDIPIEGTVPARGMKPADEQTPPARPEDIVDPFAAEEPPTPITETPPPPREPMEVQPPGLTPGVIPLMEGVTAFKRFYEGRGYDFVWGADDALPYVVKSGARGRGRITLEDWATKYNIPVEGTTPGNNILKAVQEASAEKPVAVVPTDRPVKTRVRYEDTIPMPESAGKKVPITYSEGLRLFKRLFEDRGYKIGYDSKTLEPFARAKGSRKRIYMRDWTKEHDIPISATEPGEALVRELTTKKSEPAPDVTTFEGKVDRVIKSIETTQAKAHGKGIAVSVGDGIEFSIKGNTFSGKVKAFGPDKVTVQISSKTAEGKRKPVVMDIPRKLWDRLDITAYDPKNVVYRYLDTERISGQVRLFSMTAGEAARATGKMVKGPPSNDVVVRNVAEGIVRYMDAIDEMVTNAPKPDAAVPDAGLTYTPMLYRIKKLLDGGKNPMNMDYLLNFLDAAERGDLVELLSIAKKGHKASLEEIYRNEIHHRYSKKAELPKDPEKRKLAIEAMLRERFSGGKAEDTLPTPGRLTETETNVAMQLMKEGQDLGKVLLERRQQRISESKKDPKNFRFQPLETYEKVKNANTGDLVTINGIRYTVDERPGTPPKPGVRLYNADSVGYVDYSQKAWQSMLDSGKVMKAVKGKERTPAEASPAEFERAMLQNGEKDAHKIVETHVGIIAEALTKGEPVNYAAMREIIDTGYAIGTSKIEKFMFEYVQDLSAIGGRSPKTYAEEGLVVCRHDPELARRRFDEKVRKTAELMAEAEGKPRTEGIDYLEGARAKVLDSINKAIEKFGEKTRKRIREDSSRLYAAEPVSLTVYQAAMHADDLIIAALKLVKAGIRMDAAVDRLLGHYGQLAAALGSDSRTTFRTAYRAAEELYRLGGQDVKKAPIDFLLAVDVPDLDTSSLKALHSALKENLRSAIAEPPDGVTIPRATFDILTGSKLLPETAKNILSKWYGKRQHGKQIFMAENIKKVFMFDVMTDAAKRNVLFHLDSGRPLEIGGEMRPVVEEWVRHFKNRTDMLYDMVNAVHETLGLEPINYVNHYLPRMFKNPEAVPDFQTWLASEQPVRPRSSRPSFTRHRVMPDITLERIYEYNARIDAGHPSVRGKKKLELVTENPAELLTMLEYHVMDYVTMCSALAEMESLGLAKRYIEGPNGKPYERVRVGRRTERRPVSTDFVRLKTNFGKTEDGLVFFATPEVANIFNVHTSRTLWSVGGKGEHTAYRIAGGLYRTLRWWNNINVSLQLSLSGYHALFTSFDVAESYVAMGLLDIIEGRPLGALKNISMGATVLPAVIDTIYRGKKIHRNWYDPEGTVGFRTTGNILNMIEMAGATPRMEGFYSLRPYTPESGAARIHMPVSAVQALHRDLINANYAGVARGAVPGIVEVVSYPIMQLLVPRYKAGLFAKLLEHEVMRHQPESMQHMMQIARSVQNSIDNRLGQLDYNRLFIPRVMRDTGQLMFRALGWQIGAVSEIGLGAGRLVTQPKRMGEIRRMRAARGEKPGTGWVGSTSKETAYLMSMLLTNALWSAAIQYIATGEMPRDWRDYAAPRIGGTNPDGRERRVYIPSYTRDLVSLWKSIERSGILAGTWEVIGHKLSPAVVQAGELLTQRDWQNKPLAYSRRELMEMEDRTSLQKAGIVLMDIGKFLSSQAVPFVITNADKADIASQKFMAYLGLPPAPKYAVNTYIDNLVEEAIYSKRPVAMSKTESERNDRKRELTDMIVNYEAPVFDVLSMAIDEGVLNPENKEGIRTFVKQALLKRAGLWRGARVEQVSNEWRERIARYLFGKWSKPSITRPKGMIDEEMRVYGPWVFKHVPPELANEIPTPVLEGIAESHEKLKKVMDEYSQESANEDALQRYGESLEGFLEKREERKRRW